MTDIMLVDDEVLALEYLKNMVDWERNGYHVVGCATSGKKALELFDRTHPQIVISDIRMPGTDGLELTRQIKEKGYDDCAIYCGVDEEESIVDFRDAGLPARKAIVTPGSRKYTFEWLQCRTLVIDPRRTPRLYKEVIEYEHERDGNGEVIADYPDGNDHWIDALRYATSPISMRRGQSA